MFLGIHQMGAHVLLDDFGHQPSHGAACAGNQVHDLLASCFVRKSALDALDLPSDTVDAGEKLLFFACGMRHDINIAYLPSLYCIVRNPPRSDML